MRYKKAVECTQCGEVQLSDSKGTFKALLKRIGWLEVTFGNGNKLEFCSKECYDNYKEDISTENKT